MAENTGQLDKLIADKVDEKIRAFATSISNQVRDFLKDNGDYSGDYIYQPDGFKLHNSCFEPTGFSHKPVNNIYKGIKGGLELSIKDKMIATATRDLLAKVSLLS
jgi:hypothetical protein